jgi:hypothetical protein
MSIDIPDSAALHVASRRKRRKKKPDNRPMTQEERDALQFEAIKAEFDWSNDDWAAMWLPWVRVAAVYVGGDQDRTKEVWRAHALAGEAPNILEGLTLTRRHLE